MHRRTLLTSLLLLPGAALAGQQRGTRSGAAAPAKPAPAPVDAAQAKIRAGIAKLYDTSVLHRIDIVIPPEEAGRIQRRTTERLHCTITIDGVTMKNAGVRQAGGVYHSYVSLQNKPALSLKFDEFVKGQELYGLDKLVLKNGRQDYGYINEHISYEVFRRAGVAASMTAHARVTLNGMDSGIYVMREPIDKQFLIRNFGKGFEDGNLYEIENVIDFVSSPTAAQLDDEGKDGRNRSAWVAFAQAVRRASPATFVNDMAKFLDLDHFATHIAAEMATSHWDGLAYRNNNTYVYQHPKDGRFIFIPYGTDQTFGGSNGFSGWGRERPQSMLVRQMLNVPQLANRYRDEMARIGREPVWNKQLLLDRVANVDKLLQKVERSGRTGDDISRFMTNRPRIDSLIRAGGAVH